MMGRKLTLVEKVLFRFSLPVDHTASLEMGAATPTFPEKNLVIFSSSRWSGRRQPSPWLRVPTHSPKS